MFLTCLLHGCYPSRIDSRTFFCASCDPVESQLASDFWNAQDATSARARVSTLEGQELMDVRGRRQTICRLLRRTSHAQPALPVPSLARHAPSGDFLADSSAGFCSPRAPAARSRSLCRLVAVESASLPLAFC